MLTLTHSIRPVTFFLLETEMREANNEQQVRRRRSARQPRELRDRSARQNLNTFSEPSEGWKYAGEEAAELDKVESCDGNIYSHGLVHLILVK